MVAQVTMLQPQVTPGNAKSLQPPVVPLAATAAGTEQITLNLSEDSYQGDAEFIVTVDGVQVGGVGTVTAPHAAGRTEAFTLAGTFSSGSHDVSVTFLNDAYGGSPQADRNLYVDSITTEAGTMAVGAALLRSGDTSTALTAPGADAPVAGGLMLTMAEDAYQGDAQFVVTVDGVQVGGVQTVTASHAAGQSQTMNLGGSYSVGVHDVVVTFLNDQYGGSAQADRNLYVDAVSIGGATQAVNSELLSTGSAAQVLLDAPAAAAPSAGLTLSLSEDAYQGDAEFTVSVDGVQVGGIGVVTASHGAGQSQSFDLGGTYTPGSHSVVVTFINDAYGGNAQADRNLYVGSASIGGVTQTVNTELLTTGNAATITLNTAPATTPATTPTPVPTTPAPGTLVSGFSLLGVNLAGAEFDPAAQPGVVNYDYTYPTHAEIDYYASKGMNVFRLPFLWERLQPTQNGPLSQAELARMDDVVSYATSKGLKVDLDNHGYGYGYGNLVGGTGTPDSSFDNFWTQLASHYAGNANVMFGLMNEPHDQGAQQWANTAEGAIDAIRATGATSQEILVSGTAWDGGEDWVSSGNAAVMATTIHDPAHNMAFEVHQYLDSDSSGTSSSVVSPTIGAERLTGVTQWAEGIGAKLFLGEFGVASDPASLAAMSNMLAYMQAHTDAWQGGTYWAGGPWWGDYPFSIEPTNGVDKPQMAVLDSHAPKFA